MKKDNNNIIKMFDKFYDEKTDRYLTVDGVGADPKAYRCIVEEEDENEEVVEYVSLFTENELKHFKKI